MRLCRPRRCVLAVVVLAFIGWVVGAIVLYIETQVDRIFKGSPELRLVTTTPFLENVARIAMRKTGVFSTAVSATDTCAGRVFAHNRPIVTPCRVWGYLPYNQIDDCPPFFVLLPVSSVGTYQFIQKWNTTCHKATNIDVLVACPFREDMQWDLRVS